MIRREMLDKLSSDPDILACVDEVLSEGGSITFNKDAEPNILIMLPIRMNRNNVIELLRQQDVAQIIKI